MTLKEKIVSSAEHTFDLHGFTATGMDRLTEAAEVSTRTLYKQVGSKNALIVAVLGEREARFFDQFDVHSVHALFGELENWTRAVGAKGCLFLRAQGETGGAVPEISSSVARYRQKLWELIRRVAANDAGAGACDILAEQLLVLFEGAISAASYRGVEAIRSARAAAAVLVDQAAKTSIGRSGDRSAAS
jgi:AcrR family transcriptional regulator